MHAKQKITLMGLIKSRKKSWSISLILGLLTLFSSLALLVTSGWFITASAIAGLNLVIINYFFPAGAIRMFAMIRTAGRYGENVISHNACFELLKDLRVRVFQLLALTRNNIQQPIYSSSQAMHRLIIDIDRLNFFPLRLLLPWVWSSSISLIVILAIFFVSAPLLPYVLPGIVFSWLIIPLMSYMKGLRLAKDDVFISESCKELLISTLSVMTPLILWKTWDQFVLKVHEKNKKRLKLHYAEQNLISLTSFFQQLGLTASLTGCFWKGIQLYESNLLSLPWFLGIILGIMALFESLLPLATSFISLGISLYSRDRVNELISAEQKIRNKVFLEKEISFSLELKELSAKMPNALNGPEDISFILTSGDILWIKGSSGVGKSTLLEVISGSLKQTKGNVLLNNRDINELDLSPYIGYLSQKIDLFDLTLAENLRLGNKKASDTELWQVLEMVNLSSWAKSREGLDTEIGEYSREVSGGQARRIALARLFLTNRPVLLLDEPFAGLDKETIEHIFDHIKSYKKESIVIVVSHHDLSQFDCQEYAL